MVERGHQQHFALLQRPVGRLSGTLPGGHAQELLALLASAFNLVDVIFTVIRNGQGEDSGRILMANVRKHSTDPRTAAGTRQPLPAKTLAISDCGLISIGEAGKIYHA